MIVLSDLTVRFGRAEALRDVSLHLAPGDRLGVVGESGSGKSLLGLALMGMLPATARAEGRLTVEGQEVLAAPEALWRRLRARRIAMVFQEPMSALNPLRRVGDTVTEPLREHLGLGRQAARLRAQELFEECGLTEPETRMRQYPHELSGGQRQRVLIALALSCDPALLIADEPTTALDAHVGLRICDLLVRLCAGRGMALMLISHDLAVVARTSERIAVMYGGEIVETGPARALLEAPRHPYTQGLWAARPPLAPGRLRQRLPVIPGAVPALADLPPGCRFAGRCPETRAACATHRPPRVKAPRAGHAACHLLAEDTP